MLRVGLGEDIHRLAAGGPLILGGVPIDGEVHAVAHSDGDALVHALIDALLGPLCSESIGSLFPDSDPAYRGADSMELLRIVKQRYLEGVTILNLDSVVILDRPRLVPVLPRIRENIAGALGIDPAQVGIKGKTSEQTATDRVEARVVVLMEIS